MQRSVMSHPCRKDLPRLSGDQWDLLQADAIWMDASIVLAGRRGRAIVFGEAERRRLPDFRRAGGGRSLAGRERAEEIGTKLANDFESGAFLDQTCAPVALATERKVDEARKNGRKQSKSLNFRKSVGQSRLKRRRR